MKKLILALGTLLVSSAAFAEGNIEICGQKVDRIEVASLDSSSKMNISKLTESASEQGVDVQICAVGALPVAILKNRAYSDRQPVKRAIIYVPELD